LLQNTVSHDLLTCQVGKRSPRKLGLFIWSVVGLSLPSGLTLPRDKLMIIHVINPP